jgi:septum formation protein
MDLKGFEIILASGSPRRQAFFEELGIPFKKEVIPVEETFPASLQGVAIAEHIVRQKAAPFQSKIKNKQLVITADTIVWQYQQCLGKPKDEQEVEAMLTALSNASHQVITAVGFLYSDQWECIHAVSEVRFNKISPQEIRDYIATGSPLDKAGAYGIQDPFGTVHISEIHGSYTNIVGLPMAQVFEKIKEIITKE